MSLSTRWIQCHSEGGIANPILQKGKTKHRVTRSFPQGHLTETSEDPPGKSGAPSTCWVPKTIKEKMLLTLHANWITPLKNFCQKTSPPQITPEDAPTADICSRQNHRSWMEVGAGMGLLSGLCYTSRACSTRLTLKRGSNTSRDCSCSTERETSIQRLETRC